MTGCSGPSWDCLSYSICSQRVYTRIHLPLRLYFSFFPLWIMMLVSWYWSHSCLLHKTDQKVKCFRVKALRCVLVHLCQRLMNIWGSMRIWPNNETPNKIDSASPANSRSYFMSFMLCMGLGRFVNYFTFIVCCIYAYHMCPKCDGTGFVWKVGLTLRVNAARRYQAQIFICARCNGLGKLNQIDK